MAKALAHPHLVSLAAGFVDQETLPTEATLEAIESIFSSVDAGRAALQYGSTPGDPKLRSLLLDQLRNADGQPYSDLSIDRIVVTPGSNQLLHLIADTLLDPGDIVLCSAPTYFVYMGGIRNVGAKTIGVTTDEHGIVPEALNETLEAFADRGELHRIKAIYLMSYFDNPRGVSVSLARRQEIIEIAKRWQSRQMIYILEDAAYRELRYGWDDVPSARSFDQEGDMVIHAGTFSKSFSPGIRVGWGILPESLVAPVCQQKGNIDFGSPHLNQTIMAKVLELGLFEKQVETLRARYATKLQTMLDSVKEHFGPIAGASWLTPHGGLYVWLTLPQQIDTGYDGNLFDVAVKRGVLYVPGEFCFPCEGAPVEKNTIRLSFGVQSCERIRQGVESLAQAVHDVIDSQ